MRVPIRSTIKINILRQYAMARRKSPLFPASDSAGQIAGVYSKVRTAFPHESAVKILVLLFFASLRLGALPGFGFRFFFLALTKAENLYPRAKTQRRQENRILSGFAGHNPSLRKRLSYDDPFPLAFAFLGALAPARRSRQRRLVLAGCLVSVVWAAYLKALAASSAK